MGGSFRNPNRGSGKSIGFQLMAGFCAHVLLFNSSIRNSWAGKLSVYRRKTAASKRA
jgi:hypothetical protein